MNCKKAVSPADSLRAFGFAVIRQFFQATALADEIDRVMSTVCAPQHAAHHSGINFQYVPMMTTETPVSLSLLDRAGALAEALLGGPALPTRAKGVRYIGRPITSIGFIAYCESLNAENGALRLLPGSHYREYGDAIETLGANVGTAGATLPAHVIETEPGDLILIEEHLFHASSGGAIRRQWRADYLRVPTDAETEKHTRRYFENIYPADWDGGYDVDRYPSYGFGWKNSGRSSVAELERLGVYDLAARQEAFIRTRRRSEVDH